jgi:hypothetical protein
MPHINHQRGEDSRHRRLQSRPLDQRPGKVPHFRAFRAKERAALARVRHGEDFIDDEVIFPTSSRENGNPWEHEW